MEPMDASSKKLLILIVILIIAATAAFVWTFWSAGETAEKESMMQKQAAPVETPQAPSLDAEATELQAIPVDDLDKELQDINKELAQ